jgi:hypothetical protein
MSSCYRVNNHLKCMKNGNCTHCLIHIWMKSNTGKSCCKYRVVTSARPCNKVGHSFWFTILAQHETNYVYVILYIHSVHKHRGNSFKLQNYKMRLKEIRLNWINSMQVKKILFSSPCQRQCELLPSLGVRRLLSVNFSHFNLFLWNSAKWTETW